MGAKSPTSTPSPPVCAVNCRNNSGSFRSSISGGRPRPSCLPSGSPNAAIHVDKKFDPTLTLVYLPHLDYNLQRIGPGDPRVAGDLRQIDTVFEKLQRHFAERNARILVVSEYGIESVSDPVHINRLLREKGLLCGPRRDWAANCLTLAPARPLPWPTINWRISM